jgi:hypothetical protein
VYIAATACPASPSQTQQDATACVAPATSWAHMRVSLPTTKLYCSYAITIGAPGTTPAPPAPFAITPIGPIATSWYYIVATCNMTGSATNSTYFTSSVDPRIQSANEGN